VFENTGEVIQAEKFLKKKAGDMGTGKRRRRLYVHLADVLLRRSFQAIAFHYLQPIIHWHRKIQDVLAAVEGTSITAI